MIWLTWRQFRTQALAAVAVLAAAAIYLFITGIQMRHTYDNDLGLCRAQGTCGTVLAGFSATYNGPVQLAQAFLIAAPGFIGIFWGAPLITRELETGTHRMVWNQSVTRTRWLAVKLAGVGLAAVVVAGLLSLLLTWWASPLDRLQADRFGPTQFASRNIVPLGYAAFAFALGTAVGMIVRRTVPAMAVTLALFIAVQIVVPSQIRPNLLTATVTTMAVDQATVSQAGGIEITGPGPSSHVYIHGLPIAKGAWIRSESAVENSAGQPIASGQVENCFGGGSKLGFEEVGACLAAYNLHTVVTYQPPSHYWPLQWYETVIFLALTVLLIGSCFWWIRRRQD